MYFVHTVHTIIREESTKRKEKPWQCVSGRRESNQMGDVI